MISKLVNMIKKATIKNLFADNQNAQIVQIQYLNKTAVSELINVYGISSLPPIGSQFVAFNLGGEEGNKFGFPYSPAQRFKNLKEGEVVVGNVKTGASVKFNADGSISVSANGEVTISGSDVIINGGKITLNGDCELGGPGGFPIARVGDSVADLGVPPSVIGVIATGSSDHTAT